MTEKDTTILKQYTNPLSRSIQEQYAISPDHYRGDIKLGLRNNDGTGVLVGVSKVGSVQGYLMQDGQRVPAPGKLYYRGIELTDIVEAHRKAGTFGFEEVAYKETLESIKKGVLYSKDDGDGDTYSMIPPTEDVVSSYSVDVTKDNGKTVHIGDYSTVEELDKAISDAVKNGQLTQEEADSVQK